MDLPHRRIFELVAHRVEVALVLRDRLLLALDPPRGALRCGAPPRVAEHLHG